MGSLFDGLHMTVIALYLNKGYLLAETNTDIFMHFVRHILSDMVC